MDGYDFDKWWECGDGWVWILWGFESVILGSVGRVVIGDPK